MKAHRDLLKQILARYPELRTEAAITEAYLKLPRHEFVRHFSLDHQSWHDVSPENVNALYRDAPVLLYARDEFICTISQPSFVLLMLKYLELKKGDRVFELGGGSGWNAALMGNIVGPTGKVVSFEIIPEMAKRAKENVEKFDLQEVTIFEGNGLSGYAPEAPYDACIFTAGSRSLPSFLFEQIKDGGRLLFVLNQGFQSDLLLVMRKKNGEFITERSIPCAFVPVTGIHEKGPS